MYKVTFFRSVVQNKVLYKIPCCHLRPDWVYPLREYFSLVLHGDVVGVGGVQGGGGALRKDGTADGHDAWNTEALQEIWSFFSIIKFWFIDSVLNICYANQDKPDYLYSVLLLDCK